MLESKREDRLFNDHLAEHFVGERGERISGFLNESLGMHFGIPQIHIAYTATRTKLINDHIDKWVAQREEAGTKMQVTNLGCGVDTRAFWLDSLAKAERYVEVDVESINNFKAKKLEEIKAGEPKCQR